MALFVVAFFLYSKGFRGVRTADACELTLRVLAGLAVRNSLSALSSTSGDVLTFWWLPGGFSRMLVQVLVL